jgi:hypothetical protein
MAIDQRKSENYPLENSPGRRRVRVRIMQTEQSPNLRYQQYYTIK